MRSRYLIVIRHCLWSKWSETECCAYGLRLASVMCKKSNYGKRKAAALQ